MNSNLERYFQKIEKALEEDKRTNFHVFCLNSELDKESFLKVFSENFDYSEEENFHRFSQSYEDKGITEEVEFSVFKEFNPNHPLLFTVNSKKDFRRTAEKLILDTEGLFYLWIPPKILETIKEEILDFTGSKLVSFRYKKLKSDRSFKEERRPNTRKRKGTHKSEDAYETLEEWKKEYGIKPTSLGFQIPGRANFKISNLGTFLLKKGDPDFLFKEIIKRTINKLEKVNNEIKSSKLELKKEDGLEIIKEKPVEFKLEKTLDFEEYEDLRNKLKKDNFFLYQVTKEEGSLLLNGRFVDENNGGIFSFSTNGEKMSLIPKYDSGFDSLMRFYKFLIENIDSNTSICFNNV